MNSFKFVVPIFTLLSLVPVFALSNRNSDVCITKDLEGDFEDVFSLHPDCLGWSPWQPGSYEELGLEPPQPQSSSFIYANSSMSCVRTKDIFEVTAGSMFQFNLFIQTASGTAGPGVDLYVSVYEHGSAVLIEQSIISSVFNGNSWHDVKVQFSSIYPQVYVVIDAFIRPGSLVLLDSFRYVSFKQLLETCNIYREEIESSEESSEDISLEDSPEASISSEESSESTISTEESSESVISSEESSESDISSEESSESSISSDESPEYAISSEENETTETSKSSEELKPGDCDEPSEIEIQIQTKIKIKIKINRGNAASALAKE